MHLILALTAAFWLILLVGGAGYILVRRRAGVAGLAALRQSGALDMGGKARLAVYSTLDLMDGRPLDGHIPILGRKPGAFMEAILLLVEPGEHDFHVASVQRGDGERFRVTLEAGQTWQIGANAAGHFIALDDGDYAYSRVLAARKVIRAGTMNTIM